MSRTTTGTATATASVVVETPLPPLLLLLLLEPVAPEDEGVLEEFGSEVVEVLEVSSLPLEVSLLCPSVVSDTCCQRIQTQRRRQDSDIHVLSFGPTASSPSGHCAVVLKPPSPGLMIVNGAEYTTSVQTLSSIE